MTRNANCFKAVRSRLAMAEEQLQIACKTLRKNGWTDSADELSRELRLIRMFSKPGGILAQLEAAKDWPDDWPEAGGHFMREAEGVAPCEDA